MISADKHFEFIASRVNQTSNDTEAGVKLFIPLYSAILAGSIWLRLQLKGVVVPPSYEYLSNGLVVLLTLVCIYIEYDNCRAWWGYRAELAKMTAGTEFPAPEPKLSSCVIEGVLCFAMAAACILFWIFNPFSAAMLPV